MDPLLGTLVLILVALLGARLSFSDERVPEGPRLIFRLGTHFLVLGVALGPAGLGLLTPEALEQLFPVLALGLGWIGFHFGLQLDLVSLKHFGPAHHLVAAGQAILTFVLFYFGAEAILGVAGVAEEVPTFLVLVAAATAAVTTPAGIAMVSSNFMVRGNVRDLVFFVGSLDAGVGILALAAIYTIYRPEAVGGGVATGPQLPLLAVTVGLGVVLGIVFIWLTRSRPAREELVLFVLGISALGAGAALQWGLSPLLVSLTMGTVVANLDPGRRRIFDVLERWEKPVYLTFLLLAGALLTFPTPWVLPLAFAYTALRIAAKWVAGGALVSVVPLGFAVPRRFGIGLAPQGGISLAMAVSGALVYSEVRVMGITDGEGALFAVIVMGVVLSEIVGPFLTVNLLRTAGEISPEVEEALARGDERKAEQEALRRPPGDGAPRAPGPG